MMSGAVTTAPRAVREGVRRAMLPGGRNLSDEWAAHARRIELGLTPETPVHAAAYLHPDPTPLDLDYHAAFEFGLVLEGEHERHYEDVVLRVGPGQTWLCAMWEPHGWRISAPGTREVVVMLLPDFLGDERIGDRSWLDFYALAPAARPQLRTEAARGQALAIGAELATEVQEQERERGWGDAVRFALLRLLLLLWRQWEAPKALAGGPHAGTTALSRVIPALALLHEQPGFRVRVTEAAQACGLSRSHFEMLFRQAMGLSFGRFSLRARLGAAAYEMATSERPLEVIAGHCGFVDASHLHRSFQHRYGCTPAEYRRRFR